MTTIDPTRVGRTALYLGNGKFAMNNAGGAPTQLRPGTPVIVLPALSAPGCEGPREAGAWPETMPRPSWVRRAVSSVGSGVGTATVWGATHAEAMVLTERRLQPLRGTIKGHAITSGYWGLVLAGALTIAL